LTVSRHIYELKNADIKNLVLLLQHCFSLHLCVSIMSCDLYGANAEKHLSTTFTIGTDFILEQGHWCHCGCRSEVPQHPLLQEEPSWFLARVQESWTHRLILRATVFSSRSRANTASLQMFSIRHIKIIIYTIEIDRIYSQ